MGSQEGRPFLGICLGLQLLFEGSEESGGCEGLGVIPGRVTRFDPALGLPVPHIGWNDLQATRPSTLLSAVGDQRVYFVHSYHATMSERNSDWILSNTHYGTPFVSTVNKGQVSAVQFHPEKSGATGLALLQVCGGGCTTVLRPRIGRHHNMCTSFRSDPIPEHCLF